MSIATSNIATLVDELHSASAKYRDSRTRLPAGTYRLSELPEPSAAETAAYDKLREIGRRLYEQGGNSLMDHIYDAVAERHGFHGVFGVNGAWHGIGAWAA